MFLTYSGTPGTPVVQAAMAPTPAPVIQSGPSQDTTALD